ncbi:MAG: hypothetical protein ACRC46_11200 [Thermoguttaceae bacterium]
MKSWESDEAMSVAISVAIHAALVIVLLLLVYNLPPLPPLGDDLIGGLDRAWEKVDTSEVAATSVANAATSGAQSAARVVVPVAETPSLESLLDELASDAATTSSTVNTDVAAAFAVGGGLEGRTGDHRGHCLDAGITTGASEGAIEAALQWLAIHQCPRDGGWSFRTDHCDKCACRCQTNTNVEPHGSRVAATSLALMAFLGAGHTAQSGPYSRVVQRGFSYLTEVVRPEKLDGGRIDLSQGIYPQRYINALAAIALCEGYAMGGPEEWGTLAQGVVTYNVRSQNPRDGGWGYSPVTKTRSDISITGWQVMSLKSAKLAGLHVPQETLYHVTNFLNAVADDGGVSYNYLIDRTLEGSGDGSPATCNAIGLLLRQYLGERAGNAGLDRGIERIASTPIDLRAGTPANLFQWYYASLAQHHYGGSSWQRWYAPLRDGLVQSQSRTGHERGSWFFPSPHYGDPGGRLLNTALAVMILEVPYRYMPLYK